MPTTQPRTALITGAASGIGLATARLFIERGMRVMLTDIRDANIDMLFSSGHDRATYQVLDVSEESAWNRILENVRTRFGGLDVLVNAAGIVGLDAPQDPETTEAETWRRVMAVNLEGTRLGCRAALPLLKESKSAAIVNVSSCAANIAVPGAIAYGASKAALISLSRSIALHCSSKGYPVRCNCVMPGAIRTPLWDAFLGEGPLRAQREKAVAAKVPLGRFGEPEEVAAAIAFLASDDASFITGTELIIDGGESVSG